MFTYIHTYIRTYIQTDRQTYRHTHIHTSSNYRFFLYCFTLCYHLRSADEIYASLLLDDITSDEEIVIGDEEIIFPGDKDEINEPNITLKEILNNLSLLINETGTSKFNIGRNYIWEGTKRALNRKPPKPQNIHPVKYTDGIGNSEGGSRPWWASKGVLYTRNRVVG